ERAPAAPAGLPAAPPPPAPGGRPLLRVVDDDEVVARVLAEAGERRGLEVASASGPAAARERLAARRPDAVLLDLSFAAGEEDGHDFLAELERLAPGVPVLVVTGRGSLVDRVRALQLGARGFLRKPFDPARAVEAAARLVPGLNPAAAVHVLAVDDDPQILDALGALLEPHGIRVHGVGNPLRFWTALEETSPDLVVLDVDMPHLGGIELCRVLRSDVRRAALPVLFLTASTSADTVYRVFAAGADDYVSKPIVGPELVARIRNRLERVAATRAPAGGG
ncbi:MAG TPA: response regulator, partial [Longimicrobiaceae bacterium]